MRLTASLIREDSWGWARFDYRPQLAGLPTLRLVTRMLGLGPPTAPAGSYLAACVLYAACFGAVPANPPRSITGKGIDTNGQVTPEKEQPLVEVSKECARAFGTRQTRA